MLLEALGQSRKIGLESSPLVFEEGGQVADAARDDEVATGRPAGKHSDRHRVLGLGARRCQENQARHGADRHDRGCGFSRQRARVARTRQGPDPDREHGHLGAAGESDGAHERDGRHENERQRARQKSGPRFGLGLPADGKEGEGPGGRPQAEEKCWEGAALRVGHAPGTAQCRNESEKARGHTLAHPGHGFGRLHGERGKPEGEGKESGESRQARSAPREHEGGGRDGNDDEDGEVVEVQEDCRGRGRQGEAAARFFTAASEEKEHQAAQGQRCIGASLRRVGGEEGRGGEQDEKTSPRRAG